MLLRRGLLFLCIALMQNVGGSYAADLTWTGCGITKLAFMEELAHAYRIKSGVGVELTGGGATKGIRGVAAKGYDLGGSCRGKIHQKDGAPHPAEADARLVHVAWDALVVIVHPDNRVKGITRPQLKDIFDGSLSRWSSLGWVDKPIALITRDGTDSGVGRTFRSLLFDDPDYTFGARSISVKSSGPLEGKVERFPTAMGIDGIGSASKREVRILAVDGVSPTKERIVDGSYPFYRPLYLTIAGKNPSKEAQDFVAFATSPEGQKIIAGQGMVSLAEGKGLVAPWEKRFGPIGE